MPALSPDRILRPARPRLADAHAAVAGLGAPGDRASNAGKPKSEGSHGGAGHRRPTMHGRLLLVNHPRNAPRAPSLTPAEQAELERTRQAFRNAGLTDEDIEHAMDPCTPEQEAMLKAWERGEGPWPFD